MMNIKKYLLLTTCLLTAIHAHAQENVDTKHQDATKKKETPQKQSWKNYTSPQNLFKVNFFGSAILSFGLLYKSLNILNENIERQEQSLGKAVFMKGALIKAKDYLGKHENRVEAEKAIKSIENCEILMNNIPRLDTEKIFVANDIRKLQAFSTTKYIVLPIESIHDLVSDDEKVQYKTIGMLKHEYEHLANHHCLKLVITRGFVILVLLPSAYSIWKKLEPKINRFFTNFGKKFSRLSKFLQYGLYFITSSLIIVGSLQASRGLVGKTLGRYFERCADNFTDKDPAELHKSLIGLADFLREMQASEEYKNYESTWTNYLFGPHDHVDKRISIIQERINQLETQYPELKIVT